MRISRLSVLVASLSLPALAPLTMVGCASDQRTPANASQVDEDGGDVQVHEVDASGPVDAGSTIPESDRWCAKQGAHTLCADFDGPEPLAPWPDFELDGEGLKTTSSDRSSPNALLVTQPAASGGSPGPEISISRRIPVTSPKSLRAELDLRLGAKTSNASSRHPIVMGIGRNDVHLIGTIFSVADDDTRLYVSESESSRQTIVPDFPREKWVRISLTIAIDPVEGIAKTTLAYDGTPVGEQSLHLVKENIGKTLYAIIDIGAFSQNRSTQPFETAIDNVVFDVE